MVARPDASVAPPSGIGEIAQVLRQFASNNDAVYGELTSAIRELRMGLRASSMGTMGAPKIDLTAADVQQVIGSSNAGGPDIPAPFPKTRRPRRAKASPDQLQLLEEVEAASPEAPTGKPRRRKTAVVDTAPEEPLHDSPAFPLGGTPAPYRNVEVIPRNYRAGRNQGLRGVRTNVLKNLTGHLNDFTLGGDLYESVHVPRGVAASMGVGDILDRTVFTGEEFGASNWQTETLWRNSRSQQIVDSDTAISGQRKLARATMLKKAVSSMSEGGSMQEGLAAALPKLGKVAGAVGVGVTALQQGQQFYQGQVEANRPFQRVLGGSVNEGYMERLRQNLFRIGNKFSLNPIGDRDSEAIYQGALNLYAGNKDLRGDAQSAMTDLLRSTGMRPEESLAVLRTAAKAGTDAISSIATSLKEVTREARSAGLNASEARQRFGEAYAQISKSVTGASGIMIAQAETSALTSMGHRFTDVSFDNSVRQNLFQGMQSGLNQGQLYAQRNAPGGAVSYLASQQKRRVDAAQRIFGNSVNQAMASRGITPGSKLSPAQQQEIANEVMASTGLAPEVVQQTMQALGGMEGLTAANAPVAAVQVLAGGVDAVGEYQKKVGDLEQKSVSFRMDDPGESNKLLSLLKTNLGLSDGEAQDALTKYRSKAPYSGKMGAITRYLRQVEKTGRTDPVLESLIKSYDNSRRYKVKTASGERIVGNFELIESFADQARTGAVEIVKGQGEGGSISDTLDVKAADLPGFTDPETTESATDAATASKFKGSKWDEKEGHTSGTIVVKVGADLQRWIDFQATGGASVVTTSSGIPTSGYVTPDMRATG